MFTQLRLNSLFNLVPINFEELISRRPRNRGSWKIPSGAFLARHSREKWAPGAGNGVRESWNCRGWIGSDPVRVFLGQF